jgi:hypothetical protein
VATRTEVASQVGTEPPHPPDWLPCQGWGLAAWKHLRMLESTMEVIWDLLAFLALVAAGLVGLGVLARISH